MAEIKIAGCMDHTIDNTLESANRVYDSSGISPCINTCGGGGLQPKVLEEKEIYCVASRGRNPNKPTDRTLGAYVEQRLELNQDGISNTLTSVQKDSMVLEKEIKKVGQISNDGSQYGTVISDDGLCSTLAAGTHGYANNCIQSNYRIRKLTSKECYRLMNFDDADYYAAESVCSETQLYKTAGNSIVVSCLCAIFSQLNIKGVTPWNEQTLEQKRGLASINRCENLCYEKELI